MRVITGKEREAIREFFDQMQDTARQNFDRDGVCAPVAIFMCDQGNAALPLQPLMKDKDLAAAVLNRLIDESRPSAFVFVTEAWMASAYELPKNPDGKMVNIQEKYNGHLTEPDPGGQEKPKEGVKEVVMLQCCSATGENFTLTADIARAEGSKPVLKAWTRTENAGAKGRFMFDVTPLVDRQ